MNEEKKDTRVNLGDKVVGEIELPKFDPTPYIGKKVKVALVTEHEGKHGYFIKIICEPVEVLDNGTEITPSLLCGLHIDDDDQIGWGKETKLGKLLKKYKVDHYKDLVGKEVVVQAVDRNGTEFLSFI